MRRRLVRHPSGPGLIRTAGHGGPAPGPGGVLGPAMPVVPGAPGTVPNQQAQAALGQLQQQLAGAVQSVVASVLGPGQVLLGVVLVVAGLLLATGQLQRGARAGARIGLFAATRGAVR